MACGHYHQPMLTTFWLVKIAFLFTETPLLVFDDGNIRTAPIARQLSDSSIFCFGTPSGSVHGDGFPRSSDQSIGVPAFAGLPMR